MGSSRGTSIAGRHRVRAADGGRRWLPALLTSVLIGGVVLLPGAGTPAIAAPTPAAVASPVPVTATADGGTVCDTRPMTIPAVGPASLWGAAIEVPALTGRIASMSVQLRGLDVRAVQDLDVLLVGPDGVRRATVLSDAGPASRALTGALDLTFSGSALTGAPTGPLAGLMLSGSYQPTDDASAGPDSYPAPAVTDATAGTPAPADLGVFEGSPTAGTWTLYVIDDAAGDPADQSSALPGSLGGWCLTFHQVARTTTDLAGPTAVVASQKVSYRATVRSDGTRAPGGTVVFKDGTQELGRAAVGADGIATLVTSKVAVGTRAITASYDGTGIWQDSTSSTFTTKVVPAGTDLTFTATATGSAAHPRVRLKATVSARAPATAAVDSGTVEFSSGGRKVGSGTLSAAGEVSAESDAVGDPGTITYRADYRGSTSFAAGSATAEVQQPKVPTKVRGVVITDDPEFGEPVTVSVKIFEDRGQRAPVTAGTARLLVDGVPVGISATPDGDGRVSLTAGSLTAGDRRLTVDYLGTDTWAPSSGSGTVRIDRADSATELRVGPTPSTYGTPVTLTATVSAGSGSVSAGSVTFSDGWSTLGTSGVRDGRATLTLDRPGPGIHRYSADFSGTDDIRGSAGSTDHRVQRAATTAVLSLDTARIRPDRSATASVWVSSPVGDVPDGTFVLRIDGQPVGAPRPIGPGGRVALALPQLPVGTHRIQADYTGSDRFAPSTGGTDLTVESIAVVVAVDIAPSAPRVGRSASFLATVREPDGTPVTTGRIEFSIDGAVVGTAPVDGAGTAGISQLLQTAHRLQLRARYLPDADHAPAEAQMMADISKAVASVRIVAPGTAFVYPGTLSVQATVTAPGVSVTGGSVTFSSDGVPLGAPVAVGADGRAVAELPVLPAGRHTLTARFNGTDDVGTVSARWQQTIDRAPTTVSSLVSPGASVVDGSPVAVAATVRRAGSTDAAVGRAQLQIDGRPVGSPVAIDADGRVLLEAGALPIGSHRIAVAFLPDGDHRASVGRAAGIAVVPQLAAGGPFRVAEGSSLRLVAGLRSAGTSIGWDIDGDGTADVRGADVVIGWDELTELGVDDGPSTHAITAIATRNGQSSTASGRIEVSNTAPGADLSLLGAAAPGDPVTLQISAADVSPADDASTLSVRIRWDEDGPWTQASGTIVGPQSGRWTHTYRAAGEYEPQVEITDKDGGTTRLSAGRVTVQAAPLTPVLRPEQARPATVAPEPTRTEPDRAAGPAVAEGPATRAAAGRAGAAEQPSQVVEVTALAVPLPAVAVPADERTSSQSTRPAATRTTSADGLVADVDLATDTAGTGSNRAPTPAGGVAVLLLFAAGLIGWLVRRHRLARP